MTTTFALPLSLYYVFLQGRVVQQRIKANQAISQSSSPTAGEDDGLLVACRAQGNFNENVPLALLLAGFVEANGGSRKVLTWALAALTLARVIHVEAGLLMHGKKHAHTGPGRPIGFFTTLGVELGLAGYGAYLVKEYWGL